VLTHLKYHLSKKIRLSVVLLLFSVVMKAQQDTVQEPPAEITTVDDEYQVDPVTNKTVYFSEKETQLNSHDSIQLRKVPDSIIKALQAKDDFWYVNYIFKKKKEEINEGTPITQSTFFQTLLWTVIIGGFVAFLIIYLANSNIGLFRQSGRQIASDEEELIATDNIFEINYQREIDKAVNNGNYRLAVRLLFLRSLKNLSDKNVIQYKQDRTNLDYLMQLHRTKYYNDFFRITRNYEYAWYGLFEISRDKYNVIKNDFENFGHNLNNR